MIQNPSNPDAPLEETIAPRPLEILPEEPHGRRNVLTAIILVVAGYFGYSVTDLCAKHLQQDGYSMFQILGLSGTAGAVFTGSWLYFTSGFKAFFPSNLSFHLIRAGLVTAISFFMVSAVKILPLADFYGITFTIPFFAMALSVLVLKERVGWRRWSAASVAFLGVIILAGPKLGGFSHGVLFAGFGVLCSALNMVAIRVIGAKGPLPLYGFYPCLFIAIINIAALTWTGSLKPFTADALPWFFVHGPVIVIALLASSMGFARAPETSVVAPFQYTQAIWGILFGWVFFGNLPAGTTWAGLALIVAAGLYSFWREYRLSHAKDIVSH